VDSSSFYAADSLFIRGFGVQLGDSLCQIERTTMPSSLPLAVPSYALPEGPGFAHIKQTSALPLAGITILAVEDSRFASEALRMLCLRSGARLRRVDTLAAARRHLAVYRPDVVLIDLGLPDGNGVDLIRELVKNNQGQSVVLAISGDPDGWSSAVRAGAAGFIEKPLESLSKFQLVILGHLTGTPHVRLAQYGDEKEKRHIQPDKQALQDDMIHAADLIESGGGMDDRYVVDFVRGLARSSHDQTLEGAAVQARSSSQGLAGLGQALAQRINYAGDPFAKPPHTRRSADNNPSG
jgi:DNA-binding NarL/FixJ family response regulator